MKAKTKIKIKITHREITRKVSLPKRKQFTRARIKWLQHPSEAEVYEIWKGLPFKEKLTMILKQFFPGM